MGKNVPNHQPVYIYTTMLLFGQGSEKYEFVSWWFGMEKKHVLNQQKI
jgi:hypothetical protein